VIVQKVEEAAVDELWRYVGTNGQPRWVGPASNPGTGDVLAYGFDPRKDRVFLALTKLLAPFGITRLYIAP
jgi:IS1 family transposase